MSKQKYPTTSTATTATGAVRKGRDNYSSTKLWAKRDLKRDQAEDRQAKYDALSTKEKLAGLPPAPACARQRTRLEKQLAVEKEAKKTVKK